MWKSFTFYAKLYYSLHMRILGWGFWMEWDAQRLSNRVSPWGTVRRKNQTHAYKREKWYPRCISLWVQFTNSYAYNIKTCSGTTPVRARLWSLPFHKSHTPANWDGRFSLVSKLEWKRCWSSPCQLENGSRYQFILEARSSLPLGEIIKWSHFTPDTFRVS